jgi:hypothetical protein
MSDGRILQIFRDGKRRRGERPIQLPDGAQGNLETLDVMARIVREDSVLPDLRSFAMREIIGSDADTLDAQIDAAFQFCRDEIHYKPEGENTETVADLWSCLYGIDPQKAVGDCAVKSVALATLIALASSLTVKPFFVALQQIPGADFFNHVFVGIRRGDTFVALDATPPEFRLGDELPSITQLHVPIWL